MHQIIQCGQVGVPQGNHLHFKELCSIQKRALCILLIQTIMWLNFKGMKVGVYLSISLWNGREILDILIGKSACQGKDRVHRSWKSWKVSYAGYTIIYFIPLCSVLNSVSFLTESLSKSVKVGGEWSKLIPWFKFKENQGQGLKALLAHL